MDWKQLLASTTRSVDEELRLRNAYLAVENRLLRHHITGRVQLTDAERKTLAEMGQKLGKKALAGIATIAQPETILAWHRTRLPQTDDSAPPRKSVGRPRIDPVWEALAVRMARENRSWGYDRIVGALHNLGYTVSDQTVGNILKRLRKGSVAGMTVLCHRGWLRLLSLWSPDGQRDAERGRWLGRAAAPSRRLRLGKRVLQPLCGELKMPDGRDDLPHGRERMVLMPAANRHRRRDGPLRYRQR